MNLGQSMEQGVGDEPWHAIKLAPVASTSTGLLTAILCGRVLSLRHRIKQR